MHTNTIVSILGLAASASAHVVMNTPKGWEVNNSPLELDGSDFPCKGVSYDSSVSATKMNKGEKQPMKFTGSAVHGGGSCQVSLTTDAKPTKDSVWKVIKSFEGGCPAQGIDENYPENAGMELPDTYNFEIPDDVPDGKYTLAWTWFNKVGNREMYMNCAPIEASGGGGDESAFGALPDMFTANIFGESTCRTPDSVDLEFPDAGQYVEKLGSGTLTKMEATDCPSGGSGGGSSGGDYSGGGSEETTPTESGSESSPVESGGSYESAPAESGSESPAESGAAQPSAQPSAPSGGGIFAPIDGSTGSPSSSAEVPAETSAAASPVESSPSGEQGGDDGSYQPEEPTPSTGDEAGSEGGSYEEPLPSQDVPAQGSQEDGSGSGSESGGSAGGHEAGAECESNGAWNCIDGATYQRCASGVWSAVMQLSQGTECTPGEGENLQMVRKRGLTRFGAKFLL